MENRKKNSALVFGAVLLALFVLWTALLLVIDRQPLGTLGTEVGFAAMNIAFHRLVGVHMTLYVITDWLGILPLGVVFAFAVLGLCQWIRRGKISLVDRSVLSLGALFVTVGAAFLFFERVVINYRPILIEGRLEASYPSSTTLLVLSVMPSACFCLCSMVRSSLAKRLLTVATAVFCAAVVILRTVSGVHYLSDIIGGALLASALVLIYVGVCCHFFVKYYKDSSIKTK